MTPDEARNVLLHACDDLPYIDIRHQDEEWYEVMHEVVDLILAERDALLTVLHEDAYEIRNAAGQCVLRLYATPTASDFAQQWMVDLTAAANDAWSTAREDSAP